jgi:hypothetical protein
MPVAQLCRPPFLWQSIFVTRTALDSKSVEDADWDFENELREEGFSEGEE